MEKITVNIEELLALSKFDFIKGDAKATFESVIIDSRKVTEGCLFVALKGDNFDGHDFILSAISSGAKGIIINKDRANDFKDSNAIIIACEDTIIGLGEIAKIWRSKLNAKVISITGSNGKTSTKEFLSTILSTLYKVVKTEGNNNNHIGVPLTILSADETTEMLVLEHGTNHFNEISYTAKIAQPNFAMITNIGDSHLEYLNDRNGVLTEKLALFEETMLNNGYVFINLDDKLLGKKVKSMTNKITFSFNTNADVRGKILGYDKKGRTELWASFRNTVLEVSLPIYGMSNAKNVLAAISIAQVLGLSKKDIVAGIKNLKMIKGRLQVLEQNNYILIDDTYNANPDSMKAALQLMSKINVTGKKIAVLGDMFELGEDSEKLHREIGDALKKSDLSEVLLLGNNSLYIWEELKKSSIKTTYYEDRESIKLYLSDLKLEGNLILVKGSRGMQMEHFVKLLLDRGI